MSAFVAATIAAVEVTMTAAVSALWASGWAFWTFDIIGWLVDELTMGDFDFAFFDADDDDLKGVADFDDVIRILDVFPIESGDMAETIAVAEEVDEGAIVLDAGDFAFEDFADLRFANDTIDDGFGLLELLFVAVIDGDGAVFLDVDLSTGVADDALDGFAAFADDLTDLGGIDLEGDHLWSVFANLSTWGWDGFRDDFADLSAGFVGLGKSFA